MVKVIGIDMAEDNASVTYIQILLNNEPFTFFRPYPEELPNLFVVEQYMVEALHKQGFHPTACVRNEGFEMYKLEVQVIPAHTYEGLLEQGVYKEQEVGRIGCVGAKGIDDRGLVGAKGPDGRRLAGVNPAPCCSKYVCNCG